MRWLMPIPVCPAITAGTHPPLGVTETTHPSSSAASMDVVPDGLSCSPPRRGITLGLGAPVVRQAASASR